MNSEKITKNLENFFGDKNSQYYYITFSIIIFIVIILFGWIFNRLSIKDRSCTKLDIFYPTLENISYIDNNKIVKPNAKSIFDISDSILKNYYIKSSYNSCCGDGYKNNFVDLCALEKCIRIGCRFLDFEIYSYNNEPIIASSTANNNYIKETYNSLLLKDVLNTIKNQAFDSLKTNCANDPLILNFRIMSTNLSMLENMGDLFEEYLDVYNNSSSIDKIFSLLKGYNYQNENNSVLNIKMRDLYKKIIIICDFNPSYNILQTDSNNRLSKLKKYINLKAKGNNCAVYRFNEIVSKGPENQLLIDESKRKLIIILPNLNNSTINYDSTIAYNNGCQIICMKHQNLDNNLIGYNKNFTNNGRYSFIIKSESLITKTAPDLDTPSGISLND